jgi:protein-S-isoprenylcysteine O-methyltransferase Ste14
MFAALASRLMGRIRMRQGNQMEGFTWLINIVVILGMAYLIFAMALAGWLSGLRRGEAVTLLPEQGSRSRNLGLQSAIAAVSLVLCGALIYLLWIPVPISLSPRADFFLRILGLGLFVAGTLLVLWARKTLGRMWGLSTSRKVKLLPDHRLVTTGPYKAIRHPMYSGWWLALIGAMLIYRTWILLVLLVFSVFVFARRARLEEQVLSERFGAEWGAYAASSKSLIPFIY